MSCEDFGDDLSPDPGQAGFQPVVQEGQALVIKGGYLPLSNKIVSEELAKLR